MHRTTLNEPTSEQIDALVRYARAHGRCWKADLCADWSAGRDDREPLLRQLRNHFGPRWLIRFKLPDSIVSATGDATECDPNAV